MQDRLETLRPEAKEGESKGGRQWVLYPVQVEAVSSLRSIWGERLDESLEVRLIAPD